MYLSCHNIYSTFTRLEGSLPSLDVVAFSAYVTYTSHKYSAGDCPELITRWSLYLKKFAVPIYFQFGFLNPFVTGINLKAQNQLSAPSVVGIWLQDGKQIFSAYSPFSFSKNVEAVLFTRINYKELLTAMDIL